LLPSRRIHELMTPQEWQEAHLDGGWTLLVRLTFPDIARFTVSPSFESVSRER